MQDPPAHTNRPTVLFLGTTYAGHATRFGNLRENTIDDDRIRPSYRSVTGWSAEGRLERISALPRGMRGRLRAVQQASAFATLPRPDAIWLSAPEVVAPFLWSQVGPLKRPVVLDLDATPAQLDRMSWWYFRRPAKRPLRRIFGEFNEGILRRSVAAYTPWSRWAADGLRDEGVPDHEIHIIPPGVDLAAWRPNLKGNRARDGGPLRLLFVGGNFKRKGGDLLMEIASGVLGNSVEVDVVTRDEVDAPGNVRVHRAEANSAALRALYAAADVFVMPTRAECFGIAAVEAMASGLPVIMGDVGGARDIVDDGSTGWLIEPTASDLHRAVASALGDRDRARAMGRAARVTTEARFDSARNDRAVVDLILELTQERLRPRQAAHDTRKAMFDG